MDVCRRLASCISNTINLKEYAFLFYWIVSSLISIGFLFIDTHCVCATLLQFLCRIYIVPAVCRMFLGTLCYLVCTCHYVCYFFFDIYYSFHWVMNPLQYFLTH